MFCACDDKEKQRMSSFISHCFVSISIYMLGLFYCNMLDFHNMLHFFEGLYVQASQLLIYIYIYHMYGYTTCMSESGCLVVWSLFC